MAHLGPLAPPML